MDKKLLSIVQNTTWAMKLDAFRALQTNLNLTSDDDDELNVTYESPIYNIINEVAIIPIKGIISKNVSVIEKILFDVIDIDDITAMFDKANKDDIVKSIVLDINSPGGNSSGIPEAYDKISNSSKPVIAYTDEMISSGAYWLASAANAIYGTKSSELGSIGCFTSIIDSSKFLENQGFKNDVIVSTGSKYKAAGMPGTTLNDEQRAEIQKGVDYINDMFHTDVNKGRNIAPDDMEGQTFFGQQAQDAGYIDSLVSGINTSIMDSLTLGKMVMQTVAVQSYNCQCIKCGHTMSSDKHCKDIKCLKCGGEMRRVERPGPGR